MNSRQWFTIFTFFVCFLAFNVEGNSDEILMKVQKAIDAHHSNKRADKESFHERLEESREILRRREQPTSCNPLLCEPPFEAKVDDEWFAARRALSTQEGNRNMWESQNWKRDESSWLCVSEEVEDNDSVYQSHDLRADALAVTNDTTLEDPNAYITEPSPDRSCSEVVVLGNSYDESDDIFSISLEEGDILGCSSNASQIQTIIDPNGVVRFGSYQNFDEVLPDESNIPNHGGAQSAIVATTAGRYFIAITHLTVDVYVLHCVVDRPYTERTGVVQKFFFDFNGDTFNPQAIFNQGIAAEVTTSPMNAYVDGWGVSMGGLIDLIMDNVNELLFEDILNSADHPFSVELFNSRDDPDTYGIDPTVAKVVIGGSINETGLETIGIASHIDIGNYKLDDFTIVLLDLLSDPDAGNYVFNLELAYERTTWRDKKLIAKTIANVAVHEIAHLLGVLHTENSNAALNLQDRGGLAPAVYMGAGHDNTLGNKDDVPVVFQDDQFEFVEGLTGFEDCNKVIGWVLSSPECLTNDDCSSSTPRCDSSVGKCVECIGDAHCKDGETCEENMCIGTCQHNWDCSVSAPKCKTSVPKCVECFFDRDCKEGETCENDVCVGTCTSNSDCSYPTPKCKTSVPKCVECFSDENCWNGETCEDNICKGTCVYQSDCSHPRPRCKNSTQKCVECFYDDDCRSDCKCSDNACIGI